MSSIVRVSILTIPEGRIDEAAEAMRQAEEELRGTLQLKGLRAYFAGVDRARSQLTNVSVWDSLENPEPCGCASARRTLQRQLRLLLLPAELDIQAQLVGRIRIADRLVIRNRAIAIELE
jgi:hypothetical protein